MHPSPATSGRRAARCLPLALVAVLLAPALQGCDKGVGEGATGLAVAPGRPGTGNGVRQIAPQPESITESPQVGGARGRVPEGVTGSGAPSDYPGELQANESVQRAPGSGLDGGLGAPERATAAASGRT